MSAVTSHDEHSDHPHGEAGAQHDTGDEEEARPAGVAEGQQHGEDRQPGEAERSERAQPPAEEQRGERRQHEPVM